jgi:hypothetical protein
MFYAKWLLLFEPFGASAAGERLRAWMKITPDR